MKLVEFRQNNSGGRFRKPSVYVFVEADSIKKGIELSSKYFSVCEDSGRYADYDNCGCCPCCGHRWPTPDLIDSKEFLETISFNEQYNMEVSYKRHGDIAYSLIKSDGSIFIVDNEEKKEEFLNYILNN